MPESKPHLMLYTPSNMGVLKSEYGCSLVSLVTTLSAHGVRCSYVNAECSDISVGRSTAIREMLADDKYTHLLFLDADMEATPPDAVLKMIAADEDVVAGAYPARGPNPIWNCRVAPDALVRNEKGLIEAIGIPTGFLLLKRACFEKLMAAHPELKLRFGFNGETDSWLFFHARPSRERPRDYISDDYGFSELWRELGGKLWIYPDISFRHFYWTCNEGNFGQWLALNQQALATEDAPIVGVPATEPPVVTDNPED